MDTPPALDLRAYQGFLVKKNFGGRPKPLSREQVAAGRELRLAVKAEGLRFPNCTAEVKQTFTDRGGREYVRHSNGRVERVKK